MVIPNPVDETPTLAMNAGNLTTPPPDDDISVATATIENRFIQNPTEIKEYVIKFLFRPKTSAGNTEVARTHYAILKTINEIYSDTTTIYDNYGSTMKEFSAPKSYDEYLRHFKLQYVKANTDKNRKPIYLVFHRFRSTVPISEVRKHTVISSLLQKQSTRMSTHLWTEDETRISNIGFYVNVDPSNYLKDDFEEKIKNDIASTTGRAKKKIPKFQCSYSSPFVMSDDGVRIATKSYDLQCRQRDAKDIVKLLQEAYGANPTFIFHRLRHKNLTIYKNAIRKQNAFLAQSRVVPIHGVSEDAMFALDNELMQVKGVKQVLRHRDTVSKGRWSLMTTEADFKYVVLMMKEHLPPWVKHFSKEFPPPSHFPPPAVAFRNNFDEDSEGSDNSFATYMSACSSIFNVEDIEFNSPPAPTNAAPQAWGGDAPDILTTAESAPAVSGITQDEHDKLVRENNKLIRTIEELTRQVKSLAEKQAQTQPPPPPISPPVMDIQQIIAALQSAVALAAQQQSQPDRPQNAPTVQPEIPTNVNVNESNNALNMSMDASEEDSYRTNNE
jgi:hypothetical protein